MDFQILSAFLIYFSIVLLIGFWAYKKTRNSSDLVLADRSLNYWVTAIAAHAGEMSSWLFMAFPAAIYSRGLIECWTAIGLAFFAFLNWRFIAPRLRVETEKYNAGTISTYFEKRFNDSSGRIKIVSAALSLVFFTLYASAILVSIGRLFQDIFLISYHTGITFGAFVVFVTLLGGFLSIVWIDFFQGLFLLSMILLVPAVAFGKIDGFGSIISQAAQQGISLSLIPSWSFSTFMEIIFISVGWGLGYFGQPHILNKFMGISDVKDMRKAQRVGLSWQGLSMFGAVLVGLIGIAFFRDGLPNSEFIFVHMVKILFPSFLAGFVLCAIVAAAINVIGSLILSAASIVIEDFYKNIKNGSRKVSSAWIACVGSICVFAYLMAFNNSQAVYSLVLNAWSGLGCTFGPLLLVALNTKISSRNAALSGVVVGGLVAGIWPYINVFVPPMIVGFSASMLAIFAVNYFEKK